MGDFQGGASRPCWESDAPNLSPSVIARLRGRLGNRLYAMAAARPVGPAPTSTSGLMASTCRPRMEPQAECMLVLIGATPEGKKGACSASRWASGKARRAGASYWSISKPEVLAIAPELATGDGAPRLFGRRSMRCHRRPRHQRCTVHKTANVLDKLAQVRPARGQVRPA